VTWSVRDVLPALLLRIDERREQAEEIRLSLKRLVLGLLLANGFASAIPAASGISDRNLVKRATLSNGLRVVIIQDSLAPVATVEMNVLAGGNESPPGYPGMAHAQEHMAFVAAQK
jgi:zinc protease